jgi:hypothetical protein
LTTVLLFRQPLLQHTARILSIQNTINPEYYQSRILSIQNTINPEYYQSKVRLLLLEESFSEQTKHFIEKAIIPAAERQISE